MKNLSAEMVRFGVSVTDLQSFLDCTDKTVRNKLSGTTEFSVREALRIRDKFFPGYRIEYLFASEPEHRGA